MNCAHHWSFLWRKVATTGSALLAFLSDPEWGTYLRYEWTRNPLATVWVICRLGTVLTHRAVLLLIKKLANGRPRRVTRRGFQGKEKDIGPLPNLDIITSSKRGYLFSEQDIPTLVEYARKNLQDEVNAILEDAEFLAQGMFRLASGTKYDFRGGVPWHGPFQDIEELFYLNRWYHGVTLAKAYAYTGSMYYVERYLELLEQWSAANPSVIASPVWESYSVGERICAWLFAHYLLLASPLYRSRGVQLLGGLLSAHAEYLSENLEDQNIHNHLINNARALFTYGLLCPALPNAENIQRQGWKILLREIARQLSPDGMLEEQSTHYHFLILSRYAEVVLLAQRNGVVVPTELFQGLRRMFEVANLFVRPDRTMVMIGDVSPDVIPHDLVGILALGPTFCEVASEVPANEYALWYMGGERLTTWFPKKLNPGLYSLSQSGYAIYRTPRTHLVLRCDPRTEVIRHGHQDVLGVDLWMAGNSLLIDPGNSSFNNDIWYRYFRGPHANNTIMVDGLPPYVRSPTLRGLFPVHYTAAMAGFLQCEEVERRVLLRVRHTGYERLSPPVVVERTLQLIEEDVLLIRDHLKGNGPQAVEIFFNFGPNQVERGLDALALRVYTPTQEYLAEVGFKSDADLAVHVRKGRVEPTVDGWWSPAYGVRLPASVVVCRFQLQGSVCVESSFVLKLGKS